MERGIESETTVPPIESTAETLAWILVNRGTYSNVDIDVLIATPRLYIEIFTLDGRPRGDMHTARVSDRERTPTELFPFILSPKTTLIVPSLTNPRPIRVTVVPPNEVPLNGVIAAITAGDSTSIVLDSRGGLHKVARHILKLIDFTISWEGAGWRRFAVGSITHVTEQLFP